MSRTDSNLHCFRIISILLSRLLVNNNYLIDAIQDIYGNFTENYSEEMFSIRRFDKFTLLFLLFIRGRLDKCFLID